jgi:large subunit ribosomal protein L18Ae
MVTTTSPYAISTQIKHYEIIGRARPKSPSDKPTIYRMRIFAPNTIVAKSRFWYFIRRNSKVEEKIKKTNGEILHIAEVEENDTTSVKNFGIWIRYNSRSGITNMYKEYRDVRLVGAVHQMFVEMAARHRARFQSIHIVKTCVINRVEPAGEEESEEAKAEPYLRRPQNIQFAEKDIKFPLPRTKPKIEKKYKKRFAYSRPKMFSY